MDWNKLTIKDRRVYIDGMEVRGIKKLTVSIEGHCAPEITIEMKIDHTSELTFENTGCGVDGNLDERI